MVCCVCGKQIPRGKRYVSPTLKAKTFCSKECYETELKKSNELIKLRDYIDILWDKQVNWPFMQRQIDSACENFCLTYKQLYQAIKYAVELEDYCVNPEYGLMQFERFIVPALNFNDDYARTKQQAKDIPIEDDIVYIKPSKQRARLIGKDR